MEQSAKTTPIWLRLALVAACAGAILAAVLVVGPASVTTRASQRVVTAERGVVQSTVSGSGSLQAANQVDVNFATTGTLLAVYVSPGQHVAAGQLLAELDSRSAQVSVEQAQASLDSAQAKLAQVQANPSGASSSSTAASSPAATTASTTTPTAGAATAHAAGWGTSPSSVTTTGTTTTPVASRRPTQTTSTSAARTTGSAGTGASPASTTSSASTTSPAMQAANLASAQAAVDSARLSLESAQLALGRTKLYAPDAGTVASLASIQPGQSVGTGGSSGGASSSGASSSGASSSGGGASGAGAGGASSAASSSSSASSSAFIVLVDLSGMNLLVPFSESDITKLKVGQAATVSVNAVPNTELEAHVASIDTLATTNSGVVSYDVTFHLDQTDSRLRPGMTATAQVVVSQSQGAISVPTAAISRSAGTQTVTLVRNGRQVQQPVLTGVTGDSTTEVVSGLSVGDQVVITTATNLGGAATGAAGGAAAAGGGAARALGGGGLGGALGGGGGGGFVQRVGGGG